MVPIELSRRYFVKQEHWRFVELGGCRPRSSPSRTMKREGSHSLLGREQGKDVRRDRELPDSGRTMQSRTHSSTVIFDGVKVAPSATIGPLCVIGKPYRSGLGASYGSGGKTSIAARQHRCPRDDPGRHDRRAHGASLKTVALSKSMHVWEQQA